MSAAGSIIGQCAECCECPTATVEWDSRSASLTKCGHSEFGTASTPPKKYLVRTITGSISSTLSSPMFESGTGTITYDSAACTFAEDGTRTIPGGTCPEPPFSEGIWTATGDPACEIRFSAEKLSITDDCDSIVPVGESFRIHLSATSSTNQTWIGCGASSGTITIDLSSEYTTAQLKTNTVAALPAYDDDWNDTPGSYANLSTDELTYSIRESRYRLRFKIPKVGFGTCYFATWVERFTPEGGGTPTDTPRNWQWAEGDIPDDYDPDDPTTYPIAGESGNGYFELPVPTADGTATVEDIEVFCRNCEEVSNIIPSI